MMVYLNWDIGGEHFGDLLEFPPLETVDVDPEVAQCLDHDPVHDADGGRRQRPPFLPQLFSSFL
ncbi:hypothetical protein [Micromonospora sp. NPDC049301]|uniref:hypothetical protein n=1 Tax=Micromonospora sp. NPDC049301 TaxID=3155723 RepID=UPI0034120C10